MAHLLRAIITRLARAPHRGVTVVVVAAVAAGAGASATAPVAGAPMGPAMPHGAPASAPRESSPAPAGSDSEVIAAIADRTMAMDLERWDWDSAVAVHGLFVAGLAAGDEAALEFVAGWVERRLDAGVPGIAHPNDVAGGLVLLDQYGVTADRRYLDAALEVARRAEGMPRVGGGAFAHAPGEVWVDSLYMTVPFLARLGLTTGDSRWGDEAVAQYLAHAAVLQDPRSGLFRHVAAPGAAAALPAIPWLRGNGWAAAAAADLLAALPPEDPRRPAVEASARRQLEGLAALQSDGGGWSTVVDSFATYEETSGAAALGYAVYRGLDGGWLGQRLAPAAARSRGGVLAQVAADGTVRNVSVGTGPQADPAGYNRMAHAAVQPWGQGWALLLLSQARSGFRWSPAPSRLVLAPGGVARTRLAVTLSWGEVGPVEFRAVTVPSVLETRVVSPPAGAATLSVSAPSNARSGRWQIVLRGDADLGMGPGTATRRGTVTVDVVDAPGRLYLPALALAADPRFAERRIGAGAGASWQPVEDVDGVLAFVGDRYRAPRAFLMPPGDSPRMIRLAGTAADRPRFAPDGALHVAVRRPDSGWDLALWRGGASTGTETDLLGSAPGDQMQPDPDPRGRRLAYAVAPGEEGGLPLEGGLLLLDLPSGTSQAVASGVARVPAWSPDGDRLAFRWERQGNSDVYFMDMNSQAVYRVTHDRALDGYPAFSPDGNCIAFVSDRGPGSAIYVADAFGGAMTRVSSGAGDTTPSWTADGRILFASDRRGQLDMYAVAASCAGAQDFPPPGLADALWRGVEAFLRAHPESEAVGGGPGGRPDAAVAASYVRRACEDWPQLDDVFGPGAHGRACESGVAEYLALYHAVRALRSGDALGNDARWAEMYFGLQLNALEDFIYGQADGPRGVGYRDTVAAVWQNPLRAAGVGLVGEVLRQAGALDETSEDRAAEVLSGAARAWEAEFWTTGVHPSTGVSLTTRTAASEPRYSLAGYQVTSVVPWTFSWDADAGQTPAEEAAWMGAGAMVAGRLLAGRLPEAGEIFGAGRHLATYALAYQRADPVHGGNVRTLNSEVEGGLYGQRRYWIENHVADAPAIPYVASVWHSLGLAFMASESGPWRGLAEDEAAWAAIRGSAEETLRAADGTLLIDLSPGSGLGFRLQDYPGWAAPCGQAAPGRPYVRNWAPTGPRFLSEIGHAAGLDVLETAVALAMAAQAHGDRETQGVWEHRAAAVLAELTANPPDPAWAACKTAPYVSANPAYHWSRMVAGYMMPYLMARGFKMGSW